MNLPAFYFMFQNTLHKGKSDQVDEVVSRLRAEIEEAFNAAQPAKKKAAAKKGGRKRKWFIPKRADENGSDLLGFQLRYK